MFEFETSSMAEPESTQKKKKKNSETTEPMRTVTTVHGFKTCEVESQFARFTEFFIYTGF